MNFLVLQTNESISGFGSSRTMSLTNMKSIAFSEINSCHLQLQRELNMGNACNYGYSPSGYTHVLQIVEVIKPENAPENKPCIVYENCSGPLLAECSTSIGQDQIPTLFMNIADAVSFAHAHGIVHGAIHSQNIIMRNTVNLKPKLFGFNVRSSLNGTRPNYEQDYQALAMLLYALRMGISCDEDGMDMLLRKRPTDYSRVPKEEAVLIKDVLGGRQYKDLKAILDAFAAIHGKTRPIIPKKKAAPSGGTKKYGEAKTKTINVLNGRTLEPPPKPSINIPPDAKTGALGEYYVKLIQDTMKKVERLKKIWGDNSPMKDPLFLKDRFVPIGSEGTVGNMTSYFPSQATYRRLCELQVVPDIDEDGNQIEKELRDGALLGWGSYGTVIYRQRGGIETAAKIYDLQGLGLEELRIRLEMVLNEYECPQQNQYYMCIAKLYEDYSTPRVLIEKLYAQTELFYALTFEEDAAVHEKALQTAYHSPVLDQAWVRRLENDYRSSRLKTSNMGNYIEVPDFLVVESEFGLTYSYFMYWFQQTECYNKYALNAIHDIFDMVHRIHEASLFHLDIKPFNMLLVSRGPGKAVPVAIDFGTTHRSFNPHNGGDSTMIDRPLGTMLYMPKYWRDVAIYDQQHGGHYRPLPLTQKVDVYAGAVTACFLLDEYSGDEENTKKRNDWEANHAQPFHITHVGEQRRELWNLLNKCLSTTEQECPTSSQAHAIIANILQGTSRSQNREDTWINTYRTLDNAGKDYDRNHPFTPDASAEACTYPDPDEYQKLCEAQFLGDSGDVLRDDTYVYLPKNRILVYKNRSHRPSLRMLYIIERGDTAISAMNYHYQTRVISEKLEAAGHSSAVKIDLANSTQMGELLNAYEGKMPLDVVKTEMEYGLLYDNYIKWLIQVHPPIKYVNCAFYDLIWALRSLSRTLETYDGMREYTHFSADNILLVRREGTLRPAFFGFDRGDMENCVDLFHELGDLFNNVLSSVVYGRIELTREDRACRRAAETVIRWCRDYDSKSDSKSNSRIPKEPRAFLTYLIEHGHLK